jgi:hypothetical protein
MTGFLVCQTTVDTLVALHSLPLPRGVAATSPPQDELTATRMGDDAMALLAATIETFYLGWSLVTPPPPTKSSPASARHQRATSDLVALLKAKAPAAPPCFDCRDTWLGWLHAAEQSNEIRVVKFKGRIGKGEANRGRIKTDELSEQIDFCRDCTPDFKARQTASGLCRMSVNGPDFERGIEAAPSMVKTEPIEAEAMR